MLVELGPNMVIMRHFTVMHIALIKVSAKYPQGLTQVTAIFMRLVTVESDRSMHGHYQ